MDKDKSRGVGGVRPHNDRGGPQAPAVRICGTAEVTPTGVGIHAFTPGVGDAFGPVEEEIAKAFLLALFEGVGDGAPGREITRLTVKQAGTALPDPTQMAPENWQTSCVIT